MRGKRGDAVYISVCVYGGPDDGRWSTRIVSNLNDRDITFDADGRFEIIGRRASVRPTRATGCALADDANAMITRDYHVDPVHGAPTTYEIEAIPAQPPPAAARATPRSRRRLRSVTNFLRELLAITPLPDPAEPNTIADVWAVPDATYGWAAKDAHYAMGSFDLADDEQLVIEGRSPECAYWGCMLWNPFMQTFDYRYQRIGINGEQADVRARRLVARSSSRRAIPVTRTGCRPPVTARRVVLPLVPRRGDSDHARRSASSLTASSRA